ncbi:hypothetical protein EIP86_000456 [Pleurotus ostreatoroseus]|nr:hypothetical protein EIP86_000456 [Pleurotus ostreatoroseus]
MSNCLISAITDSQISQATLHATFFASSPKHPPAPRADVIIPVTTLANNTGNDASVPPAFSLNVTIPQNAVQIFAELQASGNGDEEFWYLNTANEFLNDLPAGTSDGNGPFREVRMLIDGQVAGVAFPYAVIFTGGINPLMWRPITSYGALDLPNYFLDLTPFIPVLTDGQPHNFALDVVSAESDHTINQNWFVSGLLQVVTDSSSKRTTGKILVNNAPAFATTNTTGTVSESGDVIVTVKANHDIHIESEIVSGSGQVTHVVWSQSLSYSNTQSFLNNTFIQDVAQVATGSVSSTHNGVSTVLDNFSFPLNINITFIPPEGNSFNTVVDHSYDRTVHPAPFILGSTIQERQIAGKVYKSIPVMRPRSASLGGFFEETANGNFGNGTSNDTFSYVDTKGNSFTREISSINSAVVSDKQGGTLAAVSPQPAVGVVEAQAPLISVDAAKPRLHGTRFSVP